MATWITHFRVAEHLKGDMSPAEYAYFLIGNVAPDSGKLNDDKLSYTPTGEVSHFRNDGIPKWGNQNLRFYREYITGLDEMPEEERGFKLGYMLHLFLDDLWNYYIYWPNKVEYAEEYAKDARFVWEAKKDWYGLDFEVLAESPNWITWQTFCEACYEGDYLSFYPQKNIQEKIEEIAKFYNETEAEPRPDIYLTRKQIDDFVELSVHWIRLGLDMLEESGANGFENIMELVEATNPILNKPYGNIEVDINWVRAQQKKMARVK